MAALRKGEWSVVVLKEDTRVDLKLGLYNLAPSEALGSAAAALQFKLFFGSGIGGDGSLLRIEEVRRLYAIGIGVARNK